MSTIKTGTTSTTGYVVEADTTGAFVVQTGTTPTTALSISAAGVVTFPATTTIGTLYFGAGTVTDPSISTTGDSNTGIYFPGADQVAITTGGTQKLFVGSSVVVNEPGADVDFRVEGDTDANLIFADASADKVGIGTNTPAYKLDVNGGVSINAKSLITASGYFICGSAGFRWNNSTDAFNNVVMNDNGTTGFRNAIGVGLADLGTVTTSGAGVQFPATQSASSNANTLDDYEEGSFTPTIDGATSVTVTDAVGRYIKIGRYVWFQGRIDWNSLTGTTNRFGGLPFTSSSGEGEASYSMSVTPYSNSGFSSLPAGKGYLNGYVGPGASTITFTWQPVSSNANLDTSGNVYFAGAYRSAS